MTFFKPLNELHVTSPYGMRKMGSINRMHLGIDLRAKVGTSVFAFCDGEVCSWEERVLGKVVLIRGALYSVAYAHLSSNSLEDIEKVYGGQFIALSGATGQVTGPHLHFEMWTRDSQRSRWISLDPWPILKVL